MRSSRTTSVFCAVTINHKHTKPRLTGKHRVKYIHSIYAEFQLKFESNCCFCNITESRWF